MSKHHKNKNHPSQNGVSQMQNTKGVYISLPVPSPQVIISLKAEKSDLVIHSYFDTVQAIAKLESETVLKVAAKKYSFVWKIMALVCALVFLLVGLFLGYRMSPRWGTFGFDVSPVQHEKNK